MTAATIKATGVARAHATGSAPDVVAAVTAELRASLKQRSAAAVIWFASAGYAPGDLAGPLARAFPEADVIGCSTAGEFTDQVTGTGGVSAVAIPHGVFRRTAAALADLTRDATAGTDKAVTAVEATFGPLRELDPSKHLGLVLIDGMHGDEERVNERIGNAAPLLDVVGASAGDDLAFSGTWVALGEQVSDHGAVFLVAESGVPFRVVKSCSFVPSGISLRITKADVTTRTVLEFDGRPAVEAYAEAVGVEPSAVDAALFMEHPVGLMIDGEPWIRSPQAVTPEGHMCFYAQILEGMDVEIMDSGNLVQETASAIAAAVHDLGGHCEGGIMFNCILRRLEIDAKNLSAPFLAAFDGVPVAGFHTYGETWLGHVNQTLTGVLFA